MMIERRLHPRRIGTNRRALAFAPSAVVETGWISFVQTATRFAASRGAGGPVATDWRRMVMKMDADIRDHAYQVAGLTVSISRAMGMTATEIDYLRLGALLHDVGKLAVPRAILMKAGPLTADEWRIVRRHPAYARDMLKRARARPEVVDAAYAHHERWDGEGYPEGLRATDIPLAARIVAVADVVDALSSKRAYRDAWRQAEVREYVAACAGSQLDPHVVDAYLSLSLPAA